ncbi:MAG TPA: glycerophosphoryl diester phosphodiesterase membrane domain-containing protein [Thermoanaerobaculia bacterium]|nr:glycerophosphoryl diester phosphodiesterase membrane domain-containing protein [Thermoanaerobaculia bacterium]
MCFGNFLPLLRVTVIAFVPFFILALVLTQTVIPVAEGSTWRVVIVFGLALLGVPLAAGAITHNVVQRLRGREVSTGDCLRVGLSSMLPVTGVGLLVLLLVYGVILIPTIAIGGGLAALSESDSGSSLAMILVMPFCYVLAIYLYLKYFVVIPATVEERPGILSALRRSAALTQGHLWRIFASYFLISLISTVCVLPLALLTPASGPVLGPFLAAGVFPLMTTLFSTACAVVYYRLRSLTEFTDSEDIQSVFA